MKPLLYFAHCPQTEAIEALNWTEERDFYVRPSPVGLARIVIYLLNEEIMWSHATTYLTVTKKHMTTNAYKFAPGDDFRSGDPSCLASPGISRMILALDGMPIDYCKGCIDYFNQF